MPLKLDAMTQAEAAKVLGVSRQRVGQWLNEGRLDIALEVGGHRLVSRESVDCLKAARAKEAVQP